MPAHDIGPTRPQGGWARPGTVTVKHEAPGLAIVSMRSEHDISTTPALAAALRRAAAHSNVLVDLSNCTFIDSTVIGALIRAAHELDERGERFALVIPAQQRLVARTATLTGLAEFLAIYESREAALISLQQPD